MKPLSFRDVPRRPKDEAWQSISKSPVGERTCLLKQPWAQSPSDRAAMSATHARFPATRRRRASLGFGQSIVQPDDAGVHHGRFLSPTPIHSTCTLLGERCWIGHRAVVSGLHVELLSCRASHHAARAAESSNVGEEIEMVERDLKSLHAAHRKAGHGAMIAIGDGPEVRIDIRNQRLCQVVFKAPATSPAWPSSSPAIRRAFRSGRDRRSRPAGHSRRPSR